MIKKWNENSAFLIAAFSVISVSCLINWENLLSFSMPVISKHAELLFFSVGWGIALLLLIQSPRRNNCYSAKEMVWFIRWMTIFALGNIILYFIRMIRFQDSDIIGVLWEYRLHFFFFILSLFPWLFALLNMRAAVFERSINYIAASTQTVYLIHCILEKSWCRPLQNLNRIEVFYIGLTALPVLAYGLCMGRFNKITDRFLAMANITLCLLFSIVGTSRMAFILGGGELVCFSIITCRLIRLYPNLKTQIKYVVNSFFAGVALTSLVMATNIFDARENFLRSRTAEFQQVIAADMKKDDIKALLDEQFMLYLDKVKDPDAGASTHNPPAFSDMLREYWRVLAIDNNLQSPVITSGRVSYSYISPTGVEYRSSAHNVFVDYWSLFGLVGLVWIGVLGIYLFIAQFSHSKLKSTERILVGISAVIAEAASFGFALTQCVYLLPLTFSFLMMIASWCRALNQECTKDYRNER